MGLELFGLKLRVLFLVYMYWIGNIVFEVIYISECFILILFNVDFGKNGNFFLNIIGLVNGRRFFIDVG